MKTLIISDIHLASFVSKAKHLKNFLKENSDHFEKIIILGDLFDNADFNRLKKSHWDLLDEFRHLSKNKKLIWIEGNHDSKIFFQVISSMIGAEIITQNKHYEINIKDKKIILMHGHQFDEFIIKTKWWIVAHLASKIYSWVQYFDTKKYFFSSFLKRNSKLLLKISESNRKLAWNYARKHKANVIICGHTHKRTKEVSNDGIIYFNTGSWVDNPCSGVIIDENGEQKTFEYHLEK